MLNVKKFKALIFVFLLIPGCARHQTKHVYAPKFAFSEFQIDEASNKQYHIIIFIHGTLLPIPSAGCFGSTINKFFAKNYHEKKSWYQLYLDELKKKSIFTYQPNGPYGLCKVATSSSLSAQIAADYLTQLYKKLHPETQPLCYTFGWSGRLSQKKRLEAAHELYDQLMREINRLKPNGLQITLFGHSHGGNVILNLARAEETFKQNLKIDEAILIGTPVQSETEKLFASSTFKSIFHCYSHGDNVQKIDFISTQDPHSRRRFTLKPNDAYKNKLTQIELRFGKYQPGHGELWLICGKNNYFYRKNLPIFPLPAFIFLPTIINQLEQKHIHSQDVLINIDKKDENYALDVYKNQSQKLFAMSMPQKPFRPYIETILESRY